MLQVNTKDYPWCMIHPYHMKSVQIRDVNGDVETWPTSLHYIYASLLPMEDDRTRVNMQNSHQPPGKLFQMVSTLLDKCLVDTEQHANDEFSNSEGFTQNEYRNYILYGLFYSRDKAFTFSKEHRDFYHDLYEILKERFRHAFVTGYRDVIRHDPYLIRLVKTTPKDTVIHAPEASNMKLQVYKTFYQQVMDDRIRNPILPLQHLGIVFEAFSKEVLNQLRSEPGVIPFTIIRFSYRTHKQWIETRAKDIFKTLKIVYSFKKYVDVSITKDVLRLLYGCCYSVSLNSIVGTPPAEFVDLFNRECPKSVNNKDGLFLYTIWNHVAILVTNIEQMNVNIIQQCKMEIPREYTVLEVYRAIKRVLLIIQQLRGSRPADSEYMLWSFQSSDLRYVKEILRLPKSGEKVKMLNTQERDALKQLVATELSDDYELFDFILETISSPFLQASRIYFYS